MTTELTKKVYISKETHERLENKSVSGFAPGSLMSDSKGSFIQVSEKVWHELNEEADFQDYSLEDALNDLLDRNDAQPENQ